MYLEERVEQLENLAVDQGKPLSNRGSEPILA
jgi:hypothetical protein